MPTKKEREQQREHARLLYMQGEPQKSIAEKVGVSAQTITKWVAEGGWEQARAAANITRPELVNKILNSINVLLEDLAADPSPEKTAASADKLVKFAATVERLDKKTSVVDVIEVFMAFSKWLQYRMSFDPNVTPELLKTINHYHDLFISEKLKESF